MSSTFEATIRRGIPWTRTLNVSTGPTLADQTPVDFTGYSAIVAIGDIDLDETDGVDLDDEGNVTLSLTGEQTATILTSSARIAIDLISGGGVALEPRIKGRATVER